MTTQKILQVKWHPKQRLSEIYSTGLEYNILNDKLEGIHPPVLCKDFLGDAFWSETVKQNISIYSFTWTPGKMKLGESTYQMAVRFKEENLSPLANKAQSLINAFDNVLGFAPTSVTPADEGKTLIYTFDGAWTSRPQYVSLITLLMRTGLVYDGRPIKEFITDFSAGKITAPYGTNDVSYTNRSKDKILSILDGKYKLTQKYEDYKSVSEFHNAHGIVNHTPKE